MANRDLVARMRRDLTQIQLLADLGELSPQRLRDLLGSLGNAVTEVEALPDGWTKTLVNPEEPSPQTPPKWDVFQGLRDRFHHFPADRVRFNGPFGVIDGGRS